MRKAPGVARIFSGEERREVGLDHSRAGDLVLLAQPDAWFAYPFWLDDSRAPDYARTVDIHRKPGYDPVELFLDPALALPKLKIATTLLRRKLGFRALLDVIPLDTSLVKGSHGRLTDDPAQGPVFISGDPALVPEGEVSATDVKSLLLQQLFDRSIAPEHGMARVR